MECFRIKNVLKSCEQKDIESISKEAQLLYDEYMQENQVQKNIFQMLLYGWILLF